MKAFYDFDLCAQNKSSHFIELISSIFIGLMNESNAFSLIGQMCVIKDGKGFGEAIH